MRLVLAIVHAEDVEPLLADLTEAGLLATQIDGESRGGEGIAAIVIGAADNQVATAIASVRAHAHGRTRAVAPLRPTGERAEFWLPLPAEQGFGGASLFVLPVSRFERMG